MSVHMQRAAPSTRVCACVRTGTVLRVELVMRVCGVCIRVCLRGGVPHVSVHVCVCVCVCVSAYPSLIQSVPPSPLCVGTVCCLTALPGCTHGSLRVGLSHVQPGVCTVTDWSCCHETSAWHGWGPTLHTHTHTDTHTHTQTHTHTHSLSSPSSPFFLLQMTSSCHVCGIPRACAHVCVWGGVGCVCVCVCVTRT